MKYHVNPQTGNPNVCRARVGQCPFGGDESHFETREDARAYFENSQAGSFAPKISLDADGYLSKESEKLVKIHGISCPHCSAPISAKHMRILTEDLNEIDCRCGAPLSLREVEITIEKGHPCYQFLVDKESVKDAVWYHATTNENWLSPDDPELADWVYRPQYNDGSFKAHVGTQQAAMDRAISVILPHEQSRQNENDTFWLYEVQIDKEAKVSETVAFDDNEDIYSEQDPDVERYENRYEDPASISLTVKSSKLKVLGKRKITRKEAYHSPSIYNIRK